MKKLNDSEMRIAKYVQEETMKSMNVFQVNLTRTFIDFENKIAESISKKTSQIKTDFDMRCRKLRERISNIEKYLGIADPQNQSDLRLENSSVEVQQQQEQQGQQTTLLDQMSEALKAIETKQSQFLQDIKQNLLYKSDFMGTQKEITKLEEELTQIKKCGANQKIAAEFTEAIQKKFNYLEESINNFQKHFQKLASQVQELREHTQGQNQARIANAQFQQNIDFNQSQKPNFNVEQQQPSQSLQKKLQTAPPNQFPNQSIQKQEQQQTIPFLQTEYG